MEESSSLRMVRPPGESSSARPVQPLTLQDKREIFKRLVISSLDAGFLRYSRRQELLRIATQLGLGEFEACLLIAEAQFHSDQIDPAEAGMLGDYDITPIAKRLTLSMQIVSALIVAALVDVAIVLWVL